MACALLVVACASVPREIDGYQLGREIACADDSCRQAQALARATYHPNQPIASLTMYADPEPQNRSGTLYIAVFTLADRSQHAVGVHCGVGGCTNL